MYQIYVRSNVYLGDDDPLHQIGETDNLTNEFFDENIVEMKKYPDGSRTQLKIKLKEMTANETIEYLADLLDAWGRISVEWNEV